MNSIHNLWIALIILVSFVNLASGEGRIIYVDEDAPGVADGTNWQNAYNHLFDALKNAYWGEKPSEIHIAEGIYKPDEGDGLKQGDPNLFFFLISDVTIKGGYAGFGEPKQDDRDYNLYRTVLSGDLAGNDNETDALDHLLDSSRRKDNSYNVVYANFETQGAVLDGLIVSGGNATDPNSEGAGLLNRKGSIRVINCTFSNNAVQGWGGGIATIGGDTTMTYCTFNNNYASYTGGGTDAYKSMLTLINCTFKNNSAGQAGGGMSINDTHMKMSDTLLISNTTLIAGGGLYNSLSSDVEIIGCNFRNNRVIDGGGGGIYNDECNPILVNCFFMGNQAGSINNSPESNYVLDPPTIHLQRIYGTDGGGIFNYKSSPELMNCTFCGNVSGNAGGGMFNIGSTHIDDDTYCQPELTNCTFLSNFACWGGHIYNGTYGDRPTLTNCVAYNNVSLRNDTGYSVGTGGTSTTYSFIQGEGPDADNINQDPRLTPNGHLLNGSMLIDEGEPEFASQWIIDRDNEPRIIGGRVDLGADEFQDTDKDGFADAWQAEYFGDLIPIEPEKDEDHDGITNLDEYEIYGSDPKAAPCYVDAQKGSDLYDGYTKDIQNDIHGPKRSIQAGIDIISDGGTVLVAPGNYMGIGNFELDFSAKTIIIRSLNGPENTVIDCRGQGRAINFESLRGAFGVLDGFTIIHGNGDIGGGAHLESTQFVFNNCVIKDCSADSADGLYTAFSNLRINNLSVFNNMEDAWNCNLGAISFSNVKLAGQFELGRGRTDIISSWFDGPGILRLNEGASILITGYEGGGASVFRTDIKGPGHIEIESGQQLIIEGQAGVNLSRSGSSGLPDPEKDGQILVNGSLVMRERATLESTNISVTVMDVNDPNIIHYNNIKLVEASTGFGGEFFVSGNATIKCNNIESEGDRYLDLDPDPKEPNRPLITENRISVLIKEGILGSQGTLLELRAKDYDAIGTSGAYRVSSDSPGFTSDSSENWVLDKLELQENSKLNLTNRQGFEYQDSNEIYPETVYVRELIMGPNSVLNTALQTLYYQDLILKNSNGYAIARNPDTTNTLINRAKFIDIPLLGFSLGIIAMDDQTRFPHNEFDIRVRKRVTDNDDDNPPPPSDPVYAGSIKRVAYDPNLQILKTAGGFMEMRTNAPGKWPAKSVAAKGAFARAGDEDITIEFEYMFRDDPYNEAELIVYLSDHPEVSKQLRQVARIRPPLQGRPGSVGSNQFAVFSGTFPKGKLNFTRGTYVELELRGPDACCWIDNWDPRIYCPLICRDYNGSGDVDMSDYLLVLAESGLKNPANANKGCLDLMTDGVVDLSDTLVWETYHPKEFPIECPKAGNDDSREQSSRAAKMYGTMASKPLLNNHNTALPGPLQVLAKGGMAGGYVTNDCNLYGIDSLQKQIKGRRYDGTGRLVTDKEHNVYCIDPINGLIELNNNGDQVIVAPKQHIAYGNRKVTIGFFEPKDAIINDAVFHPEDPNIVYMVPIRVITENNVSYKAAVKLDLDANKDGQRGDISILRLYGDNPDDISSIDANDPLYIVHEPDYQHLREVELDADGNNLFVLSACSTNKNNWILAYEARSDDPQGSQKDPKVKPFLLNDPNTGVSDLSAPSSMLVSSAEDCIYMTSSARDPIETNDVNFMNDLEVEVYCFSFTKTGQHTIDGLYYQKTIFIDFNVPQLDTEDPLIEHLFTNRFMSFITSMTEDLNGTLYVTGYSMPEFREDAVIPQPDYYRAGWFMTPVLATIPVPGNNERYRTENISTWNPDGSLSLPLSIVWTGEQMELNNKQSYVLNRQTNINIQPVSFLVEKWLDPSYYP